MKYHIRDSDFLTPSPRGWIGLPHAITLLVDFETRKAHAQAESISVSQPGACLMPILGAEADKIWPD